MGKSLPRNAKPCNNPQACGVEYHTTGTCRFAHDSADGYHFGGGTLPPIDDAGNSANGTRGFVLDVEGDGVGDPVSPEAVTMISDALASQLTERGTVPQDSVIRLLHMTDDLLTLPNATLPSSRLSDGDADMMVRFARQNASRVAHKAAELAIERRDRLERFKDPDDPDDVLTPDRERAMDADAIRDAAFAVFEDDQDQAIAEYGSPDKVMRDGGAVLHRVDSLGREEMADKRRQTLYGVGRVEAHLPSGTHAEIPDLEEQHWGFQVERTSTNPNILTGFRSGREYASAGQMRDALAKHIGDAGARDAVLYVS